MTGVQLPSALERSLADFPAGLSHEWRGALPDRIAAAEKRWGIEVGAPFEPGGVTSYTALARTRRGREVVYKITVPHDEAVGEAQALRAYRGDGAVRLEESHDDTFELLLERAAPGTDLWAVPHDEERLDIASDLMVRLWRPCDESAIADMAVVTGQWAEITERRLAESDLPWPTRALERGIDLLRSMPTEAYERMLVHGDFHPGNILAAHREPWLVIDPKPLIGDPSFEPVQLLTQRGGRIVDPDEFTDVEGRLERLAGATGRDVDRIARWAIARTSEWSMWSWFHGDTESAAFAARWANVLDRIV